MTLESFQPPYEIHLGCGSTRLDGFINVDVRENPGTDLVHDCGDLKPFQDQSVSTVFSHAFFEHLRRDQRLPLLKDVHRVLQPSGHVFFAGIPDFETIARCYLEGASGHFSPRFDLYEVYRYTHGDPEAAAGGWLEQLHKSLFDKSELYRLVREAGFMRPFIFRYPFHDEPHPVNLGFIACKDNAPLSRSALQGLLMRFSRIYGKNPVEILTAGEGPDL